MSRAVRAVVPAEEAVAGADGIFQRHALAVVGAVGVAPFVRKVLAHEVVDYEIFHRREGLIHRGERHAVADVGAVHHGDRGAALVHPTQELEAVKRGARRRECLAVRHLEGMLGKCLAVNVERSIPRVESDRKEVGHELGIKPRDARDVLLVDDRHLFAREVGRRPPARKGMSVFFERRERDRLAVQHAVGVALAVAVMPAVSLVDDNVFVWFPDRIESDVALSARKRSDGLSPAVRTRIPADEGVSFPPRLVEHRGLANADDGGVLRHGDAPAEHISHLALRVAALPKRVKGEIAGVLSAHALHSLAARRRVVPAQEHISRAGWGREPDALPRRDLGGVGDGHHAAVHHILHGVDDVAPLGVEHDVRARAQDRGHGLAGIVRGKIPPLELRPRLVGHGQRDGAALNGERLRHISRDAPAVEPEVYGVFLGSVCGENLNIRGYLQRNWLINSVFVRPTEKIVAVAGRLRGREPLAFSDVIDDAVRRHRKDRLVHGKRGREQYCEQDRRHAQQRACRDEREGTAPALLRLRERDDTLLRLDAEIDAGDGHLEVLRKRGKGVYPGARDAALPLGHRVPRRSEHSRERLLALPFCLAESRYAPAHPDRRESAREGLVRDGRPRELLHRGAERRRRLPDERDVRLRHPALPLGHRLQMDAQRIRKLRLRQTLSLSQFFEPFGKIRSHISPRQGLSPPAISSSLARAHPPRVFNI